MNLESTARIHVSGRKDGSSSGLCMQGEQSKDADSASQEKTLLQGDQLQLLSLNEDVLSHIISYLSYPDALSLSHTCKGAGTLSLDPTFRIAVLDGSWCRLTQFRDLLLAKDSRPLLLRSLTISGTSAPSVDWSGYLLDADSSRAQSTALADILEKAINLQRFHCAAIRGFLAADVRVKDNLAALSRIKELTVTLGDLSETAAVLAVMKSRNIEQLGLGVFVCRNEVPFAEFLHGIRHFNSLTTLSLSGVVLPSITLPTSTIASIPSVRTLELEGAFLPLRAVITAFPNLINLIFARSQSYGAVSELPDDSVAEICWPTLDIMHTGVRDLKAWPNFTSAVRVLYMDAVHDKHALHAIEAVERTRPRVLAIAYKVNVGHDAFLARLPDVATDLRLLDIRMLEHPRLSRRMVLKQFARYPALVALFLCLRKTKDHAYTQADVLALVRELAVHNALLRFVGISLIAGLRLDGRRMYGGEHTLPEERQGSMWFVIRRRKPVLEEDTNAVMDVEEIPTSIGLGILNYMYEAKYDRPDWEEQLNELT